MTDDREQVARDQWQTELYEASYRFSLALRDLSDSNPWPEQPVLGKAINTLATELWDRRFSLSEIQAAFQEAAVDLPRYAAGQEIRP